MWRALEHTWQQQTTRHYEIRLKVFQWRQFWVTEWNLRLPGQCIELLGTRMRYQNRLWLFVSKFFNVISLWIISTNQYVTCVIDHRCQLVMSQRPSHVVLVPFRFQVTLFSKNFRTIQFYVVEKLTNR